MQKTLGKYELIDRVGQGAMGEVFKARDPFIGRLVALKTISSNLVGRPDLLERFYQEARSAGTLQHPNIVTIYELGIERDIPFIAMEFLEGESLDKFIEKRQAIPISRKASYVALVCRALDYAHKRRIIHRDIKPGNVMLTKDGEIKVVDFGIARALDDSNTQTNMLIGTLGYMSPQQIRGQRASELSDIWAVGVMFYELLCCERPFTGENHAALMMNIVSDDVQAPSVRERLPDCPPEVDALIGKMLRKDADQRFQTMEEVLLDFDPLLERLEEQTVSEMVLKSENLINDHDLVGAQDLLKDALEIRSNARAKSLLEKINQEIKQGQVLEKARSIIAKAENLLEQGHFQEAGNEAEAALKFGFMFAPNHELFSQARRLAEQARLVQQALENTKQHLAADALTEAGRELEGALKLRSDNPLLLALQRNLQEKLDRKKESERLAKGLQKARISWAERRYDESLNLLDSLQKEFPHNEEIPKLLEAIRNDKLEILRQQKLTEARSLLATQRFEDALAIVDALREGNPSDESVTDLRALILQAREELSQRKKLRAEMGKLRSLLNTNRPEAISLGEKLLQQFPQEPELVELMEFARGEEEKSQLESILREVRGRISSQDFQQAIAAATRGLTRFPGNAELTALLVEAEKLAERDRRLQEHLQIIKQYVAEDALDKAQEQIDKALKLEADSAQLRSLQKQVQDLVARQKGQERLSAVLQQARVCWAEQRYDECISLLTEIQKDFPRENDVIKFLQTAQNDRAEQIKQRKLGEARNLLASQRFEAALEVIAEIQKQHPGYRPVQGLEALILKAQEDYKRQQTIQSEMESLRAVIAAAKFAEAVARGEELLRKFPGQAELSELVTFAREEQLRIEKKKRLDEQIKSIERAIRDGQFASAVQSIERALVEHPQSVDLAVLLDRAKREKTSKEKRELLDKRLREIQQRIRREELSEAVDLARETQVAVGPDPAVADLLHKAEWELVEKKRRQNQAVQEAKTFVEAGNLDEATLVIERAVETQTFPKSDSRVSELLHEIQKKKADTTGIPPANTSAPKSPGGSVPWPPPTDEPAKDYVFQAGQPLPEPPRTPSQDSAAVALSATSVNIPSPRTAPPSPMPVEIIPPKTVQQQPVAPALEEPTATRFDAPAVERIPKPTPPPKPLIIPVEVSAAENEQVAPAESKKIFVYTGVAAAVLVLVGGAYYFHRPSGRSQSAPVEIAQPAPKKTQDSITPIPKQPAVGTPPTSEYATNVETENPVEALPATHRAGNSSSEKNAKVQTPTTQGPKSSSIDTRTGNRPVNTTAQPPTSQQKGTAPPVKPTPNSLFATNVSPNRPVTSSQPAPSSRPATTAPDVNSAPLVANNIAPAIPAPRQPEPPASNPAPPPVQPTRPSAASATAAPTASEPATPPPTPVQPEASSNPDQQAIRSVIQQLSAAFASRSMNELQGVWPKMGQNRNKLKSVFDSAQSITREFHIERITIRPDGLSATVVGTYEGKIRAGGKEFPSAGDFFVTLSKKGGKWTVDDASF